MNIRGHRTLHTPVLRIYNVDCIRCSQARRRCSHARRCNALSLEDTDAHALVVDIVWVVRWYACFLYVARFADDDANMQLQPWYAREYASTYAYRSTHHISRIYSNNNTSKLEKKQPRVNADRPSHDRNTPNRPAWSEQTNWMKLRDCGESTQLRCGAAIPYVRLRLCQANVLNAPVGAAVSVLVLDASFD